MSGLSSRDAVAGILELLTHTNVNARKSVKSIKSNDQSCGNEKGRCTTCVDSRHSQWEASWLAETATRPPYTRSHRLTRRLAVTTLPHGDQNLQQTDVLSHETQDKKRKHIAS